MLHTSSLDDSWHGCKVRQFDSSHNYELRLPIGSNGKQPATMPMTMYKQAQR